MASHSRLWPFALLTRSCSPGGGALADIMPSNMSKPVPSWCAAAVAEVSPSAGSSACDTSAQHAYCRVLHWQHRPPRADHSCNRRSSGYYIGTEIAALPRRTPALGFVIVLQDEADAVIRLVGKLWRQRHFFVIHADAKNGKSNIGILQAWASRYSNVEIVQRPRAIVRGGPSLLLARLEALHLLLKRAAWSLAIFLTATHYPIRPRQHLERFLWLRNLSHIGVGSEWQKVNEDHTLQALSMRLAVECDSQVRLLRNGDQQVMRLHFPPHPNVSFCTGSAHVVVRRDLAMTAVSALMPKNGNEVDEHFARVTLRLTSFLVQPDEAFWQVLVTNTKHCEDSHLLCDVTSPPHAFGPEQRRLMDADFEILSPRELGEADLPEIYKMQSSPASSLIAFIRKVANDQAGDQLRDMLDSSSETRQQALRHQRKVDWKLQEQFAHLHCRSTASNKLHVEVWRWPYDLALGPLGVLLAGGHRHEVRCNVDNNSARFLVQEKFAMPKGRSSALIAVRIGSAWSELSEGVWDFEEVGCIAAGKSVTASVYWAPRTAAEVAEDVHLRGTFARRSSGKRIVRKSEVLLPGGAGFMLGNLTLDSRSVRAGRWIFTLERLQNDRRSLRATTLVEVPFQVYKDPKAIGMQELLAYFEVTNTTSSRRQAGHGGHALSPTDSLNVLDRLTMSD